METETEKKATLIQCIITKMRYMAKIQDKTFDGGDLFFTLCFRTNKQLEKIARELKL